jgi:uncharacterized protein YqeY
MTIQAELTAELREAIRERDRRRMDVIRQIETEVSRARSAPGFRGSVDDDLYLRVIAAFLKKMEKAREEFLAAGERGRDHVAKLTWEIDYLQAWLPEALTEDDTRVLVRAAIAELGADDPKMAGRVIGHVMKSGAEGLDGSLVSRIVREELDAV